MKTLTKTHLLELLKTKQAVAFMQDGMIIDVPGDVALSWFDQILETDSTGYMAETASYVWIAADKDEYEGENLWTIAQTPQ